ncbi:MAG TPA: 4-(cytidine 5'-diphospho)-2-C-methyl-D-erythritol kinase [Terriglobales bacterium]|nr:4-(cytidine 5'-diphospho)-2-C-methyl-D-erythritol kinase [Terriglobales bacterium]
MPIAVHSFAKINLGLRIGALRADGFHELRTVYQTIALHDVLRLSAVRGSGIEIRCPDPRVPTDSSNTCYRVVECALQSLKAEAKVRIEIEKKLPVQGGLGGASANAVATLLALERALKKQISGPEKLRIVAEVGSDLPLFLVGGTILGLGRGEDVYPMPDLPATPCVIATPAIGVSTPKAFADWDLQQGRQKSAKLTGLSHSDRMIEFSRAVSAWLSGTSGVPGNKGRGRAETPLLDLVRTGIENDFEQVVFPQHPDLREVKRALEREGAFYASLSGSGSAVYGLFRGRSAAVKAAGKLNASGIPATATSTLTRRQYWRRIFDC